MNGLHFCFGIGAFLAPLLVAQVIGVTGGYRWAYWILAACATLAGLRLLTLAENPRRGPHRATDTGARVDARLYAPLIIATALFLFFYVGAEVAFGGWVYTYAVARELASAAGAAYLTSAFWLSFTLGRLLAIPLATRVPPAPMILTALGTCLAMLALVTVLPDSYVVLWIVTSGLGFGMAPLWPMGFTLAGQSLRLTASVSGMILLGDSFGGMILPWLVGHTMALTGPRALIYLVFVSLIGNALAFVAMLRWRLAVNRQRFAPRDKVDEVDKSR
jgi:FHS family Na+ dependent glucose MFS transporter 1